MRKIIAALMLLLSIITLPSCGSTSADVIDEMADVTYEQETDESEAVADLNDGLTEDSFGQLENATDDLGEESSLISNSVNGRGLKLIIRRLLK